jgi:hypothetical protein
MQQTIKQRQAAKRIWLALAIVIAVVAYFAILVFLPW